MTFKSKMTLVVVEDDLDALAVLKANLEGLGHVVLEARNAFSALELIDKNNKIDAVISDIYLPQLNGLDLLKQINFQKKNIPVILITGYADLDIAIEALKQGAFDLLRKPINIKELELSLLYLERKHDYRKQVKTKEEISKDITRLSEIGSEIAGLSHHLVPPLSNFKQSLIQLEQTWNKFSSIAEPFLKDNPKLALYFADIERDIYKNTEDLKNISNHFISVYEFILPLVKRITIETMGLQTYSLNQIINTAIELHSYLKKEMQVDFIVDKSCKECEISFKTNELVIVLYDILLVIINNFNNEQPQKRIFIKHEIDNNIHYIKISANCINLESADLENIFKAYYTANHPKKRFHFNLYNAQTILKRLNGNILVENYLQKGLQFTIEIKQIKS